MDLDTIWQQTVNSLGQRLGVSRCIICAYQSSSLQVKVAAEYCQEPFLPMLGVEISLTSAPHIIQALETLKPVVVESLGADDPFERHSLLVVATAYQEQPNGIISLHRCEGGLSGNDGNADRPWTQSQIEFVEELADQVGSAIALATLYRERSQRTQELSQFKKQFLSTASHELRTPLNHIIGYLQLTVDDMADDPIEERAFIQQAHSSALHLSQVIGNVLDCIQSSKACQNRYILYYFSSNYSLSQKSEVCPGSPMPYALCPMPYVLCPMPFAYLIFLRKAIHFLNRFVVRNASPHKAQRTCIPHYRPATVILLEMRSPAEDCCFALLMFLTCA